VEQHSVRAEDGKFVCGLCTPSASAYTTNKRYNMRTHLEAKHSLSRGYQCQHCYKVLKTRNVLNSHMAQNHAVVSEVSWQ